jgi:transposase
MPNGKSSNLNQKVPTYIPLADAIQKYGISEEALTQLIKAGKIEAVQLSSGELLVAADNGSPPKTKDQIIQEKFANLQGQPITITEAAEKYNVPRSTVEKWVERKYIDIVDSNSYPMKVNEADVSYCVEVYQERKAMGITGGVPLLDENGLPYELKHPTLSKRRRMQRSREYEQRAA